MRRPNAAPPVPDGEPTAPETRAIELEGMKVLFDDRVSLYPVDIVPKTNGSGHSGDPRG